MATDHDAEIARVQGLLGLDRQPTSGEMQLVHGCEEGYIPTSTCAEVGLSGGNPEPEQTQLSQGPDCPYLNKGVCWDNPGRGSGSRRVAVTRPARPASRPASAGSAERPTDPSPLGWRWTVRCNSDCWVDAERACLGELIGKTASTCCGGQGLHRLMGSASNTPPAARPARQQSDGFTGLGYTAIATRIGTQGGHRPQIPAPPVGRWSARGHRRRAWPGVRPAGRGAARRTVLGFGGCVLLSRWSSGEPFLGSGPGSVTPGEGPTNVCPRMRTQGCPATRLPVGPMASLAVSCAESESVLAPRGPDAAGVVSES